MTPKKKKGTCLTSAKPKVFFDERERESSRLEKRSPQHVSGHSHRSRAEFGTRSTRLELLKAAAGRLLRCRRDGYKKERGLKAGCGREEESKRRYAYKQEVSVPSTLFTVVFSGTVGSTSYKPPVMTSYLKSGPESVPPTVRRVLVTLS